MEYLEYEEEEDDNLFGSDREDNARAGPSTSTLPSINPARSFNQTAQPLVGSLKGKEKAISKDPQDRLDELRFMRMYKPQPVAGKGAPSLKQITQDGKSENIHCTLCPID
jgi:hypothetical protein